MYCDVIATPVSALFIFFSIFLSLQMNEILQFISLQGERGGSVVECRTPEREVRGSKPTAAVLCP